MVSWARAVRPEGRSSWIVVGAIALAFLAFDLWIVLGGSSPGRIPGSFTRDPVISIGGAHPYRFAAGRLHRGDLVACVTNGLRIEAAVPAPGGRVETHADGVYHGGATIRLHTLPGGAVRARCGD